MPTRSHLAALLLVTAAALAACGAPEAEPTGCRADEQCPASSRCQGGTCVADVRPVAAIRPLGAVEVFALVELDARDSTDPDHGDAITDHLWAIYPLSARCAAPEVAGREPLARVRFGCPGRYEVSLTVRDRLGIESEPALVHVDVFPSTRAPVVVAGPDVATDHACSGVPLVCRPVDAVTLTAGTTIPGAALIWSVEPPLDRALEDGTRRVLFTPTATGTSARIESDGTAISGDWVFRVEARDAYGAVGAAYTRVSVRNRSPVVVLKAPETVPHAFDALLSRFTASGELTWSAHDPDGDPLEVSGTWRHVGDGDALFDGTLVSGRAAFRVEVPYATPEDALFLRGAADLSRALEIFARDVNGAEGRASAPIEIANRPPIPTGGTIEARVPHRFDSAASRYVASAELGTWSDPDGDPLFAAPGAAPCEAVTVTDGVARVECSVAFEGTPAVERLAGRRSVGVRVRDPWAEAPGAAVYTLDILNGPPKLTSTTDLAALGCSYAVIGRLTCFADLVVPAATFTATPQVIDPDGDPVLVTALPAPGGTSTPQRAVCTAATCLPFRFEQPRQVHSCMKTQAAVSRLLASDGTAPVERVVSPPCQL